MVKGDFSRIPTADIASVLFQQGKPLVEADLNEALHAIRENQRVQLFFAQKELTEKNEDNRTYTSLKGFDLSVTTENQLKLSAGTCQVLGNLQQNPEEMVATSFKQLNDGAAEGKKRFSVILTPAKDIKQPADPTAAKKELPPPGDYVVTLVTAEKPLLLSEVDRRTPSKIGTLQASVLQRHDWHIVLEPAEKEGAFLATRNQIIGRNSVPLKEEDTKASYPLSPLQNRPHPIMVSLPAEKLARLQAGLFRCEVHEVTRDNAGAVQSIAFKLGLDNAARSLQLRKVSDSLVGIVPDQFGLPKPNELLELESVQDHLDLFVSEKLHVVTSAEANGLISSSAFKGLPTDWKKTPAPQVRLWHAEGSFKLESPKQAPEPEPKPKFEPSEFFMRVNIGDFVVRFMHPKGELAKFLNEFRKGDHWVLHSSQIAAEPPQFDAVKDSKANDEELTKMFLIWNRGGHRWGIFYAPLLNVTSKKDGTLAMVNGNENAALAAAPMPMTAPVSFPWTRDAQLASSVSCRDLFSSVELLAARRWLASMSLRELASLTKEQIRKRMEDDCPPQEFTHQTLERAAHQIVARRQQLLSLENIA